MVRRVKSKSALDADIVPTLGAPISTKELIARLLKIADELSAVDQEQAVLENYRNVAKNLANPKLIDHKNVGVQAFAACAISDIIRLYAPDAPFTPEELANIFKAFFAQFSCLWDEENPYFLQQSYILKRLVEVRSVVLISDLPESQKLVSMLFETMYTLTTKGFPPKLEHLASELLAETVSEIDYIPQDVVSLIIKRLTIPTESLLMGGSSNISNPAFVFSMAICDANADKMARLVAQLFSEMLDESAKLTNEIDRRAPFKALEKIHESSIQIWAHVPDLLASVMGLISDELNSDDEKVRELATRTIGKMLSSSSKSKSDNSAVTFVSYHRGTWMNWLSKSCDNSSAVRSLWTEQLPEILSLETTTEINMELCKGLSKCLMDSSEKVRFSACAALEILPRFLTLKKVCNASILTILFSLIRERHTETRNTAISVLADLYNNCMSSKIKGEIVDLGAKDSQEYDIVIRMILEKIPNNLLQLNYINDKSITTAVDIVLFEKMLPFDDSAETRVSRLCHFYLVLEDRSKLAFVAIVKRQKKNVEVLLKLLDLAEEFASGSTLEHNEENAILQSECENRLFAQVQKIVNWLGSQFPDGLNSHDCINAFIRIKNLRFITLLKNCVNSQLDYKTVKHSARELLSKLSDPKSIRVASEKARVTTADMVSNFKILLYRSSTILHNKSNIGELIRLSQVDDSDINSAANELINIITTYSPGVFKTHISVLCTRLESEGKNAQVSLLKSLYHVVKKFPECFPVDDGFVSLMELLALQGSFLQAKYSVKIMGCSASKEQLMAKVLSEILPLNSDDSHFATHLSVIAETYLIHPLSLTAHSFGINNVIIEEVLTKNRLPSSEFESEKDLKWVEDAQLENHQVLLEKILSIRIIANKLRFVASSQTLDSATLVAAEKPIGLLGNIISNNGEIVKTSRDNESTATPHCYRLKLKLISGLMLLKLAKLPQFYPLISAPVIRKMSRLVIDEVLQVRTIFVKSLQAKLQDSKISEKLLHLVFFMGHEPDSKLKKDVETWVLSQHHRSELKGDTLFERASVRLIHALAHDERFGNLIADHPIKGLKQELEAYTYALKYVSMFIDTVAKESNISLLYYLASRVKQHRDKSVDSSLYNLEEPTAEVLNLFRIAELFQLMLKETADSRSWNLQTWPGKINLPTDLFSPMDDYQQAHDFVSRVYIPDTIQIELRQNLLRKSVSGVKRKTGGPRQVSETKRARPSKSTTKTRKKGVNAPPRKSVKRKDVDGVAPSAPVARKSRRVISKVFYGESGDESNDSDLRDQTENDLS